MGKGFSYSPKSEKDNPAKHGPDISEDIFGVLGK